MNKCISNKNKWTYRIGVSFYNDKWKPSIPFNVNVDSWEKILRKQVVYRCFGGTRGFSNDFTDKIHQYGGRIVSERTFDIRTELLTVSENGNNVYWEFIIGEFIKFKKPEYCTNEYNYQFSDEFMKYLINEIKRTHFYSTTLTPTLSMGYPHKVDLIRYDPNQETFPPIENSSLTIRFR